MFGVKGIWAKNDDEPNEDYWIGGRLVLHAEWDQKADKNFGRGARAAV